MIIILMGVAGSGKTTIGKLLATRLGWRFYDADDFHSAANRAKMESGIPLTDANRADWLSTLRQLLLRQMEKKQSAVLACSALKETYRQILQVSSEVRFVYLKGTRAQIKERISQREGHYMSAAMLDSQFEILEEPAHAMVVDITMKPSAIIDIICKRLELQHSA
jgi:gluconokinase